MIAKLGGSIVKYLAVGLKIDAHFGNILLKKGPFRDFLAVKKAIYGEKTSADVLSPSIAV